MKLPRYLTGGSSNARLAAHPLGEQRAKTSTAKTRSGNCIHSEELISHAKWYLDQGYRLVEVAELTGLNYDYIIQLRDGIVRANVKAAQP